MTVSIRAREETIEAFVQDTHFAFDEAGDYVWKTPKLLEHEMREERAKLEDYFPGDPKSQARRWYYEGRKIEEVFPHMMATGNLFAVISLFELFCLRLALIVARQSGRTLDELGEKRRGLERSLTGLKACGLRPKQRSLWTQIDAALVIRNTFLHTNGLLSQARDADRMRALVTTRAHLIRRHRHPANEELLRITPSPLGDRALLSNGYCHVLCVYCREYLLELAASADAVRPKTLARRRGGSRLRRPDVPQTVIAQGRRTGRGVARTPTPSR